MQSTGFHEQVPPLHCPWECPHFDNFDGTLLSNWGLGKILSPLTFVTLTGEILSPLTFVTLTGWDFVSTDLCDTDWVRFCLHWPLWHWLGEILSPLTFVTLRSKLVTNTTANKYLAIIWVNRNHSTLEYTDCRTISVAKYCTKFKFLYHCTRSPAWYATEPLFQPGCLCLG